MLNKALFISNGSDALDHSVDVGAANEFVDYVNDAVRYPELAALDPINQLIMLEEMEQHEAYCFVMDLFHQIKQSKS